MLQVIVRLQGVAGVAALTGGAYVLGGVGAALLTAGTFLTLGAWASR